MEVLLETLVWGFATFGSQSILPQLEKTGEPLFESMSMYKEAAEATLSSTKMREMNLKRNALQKAYLDRWQASATDSKGPIDGIIMAVTPWAAARLGSTQKLPYVGYTGVWNVLGRVHLFCLCPDQENPIDRLRSTKLHLPSHIRRSKCRQGTVGRVMEAIERPR